LLLTDVEQLPSWNDGPTKSAIIDFVDRVAHENRPEFVPPPDRVAVFDNDGTLWCEKPMPIELGFILKQLAAMAEQDTTLRSRQPWKAAYERDFEWLGRVITEHYAGDDSNVKVLLGGILRAFAGVTVDDYAEQARAFVHEQHPGLGRRYRDCGFLPMVELLSYLETNGFTTFIASGGDRDFMRPITEDIYGIPPERVIGSSSGLQYQEDERGGTLAYLEQMEILDDGPAKPVRIWSRIGRRPILAGGNSNGDVPMLTWSGGSARPALRLLVLHDDQEREFDYTSGAEKALDRAAAQGWTVVSVKNDWNAVFADAT
jgi:phosphoglycolate phosphatase-like HAD superfamily hydrolase